MANIKTISSRLIKRIQHIAQWVDRVAKQAVITVWGSIFRIGGKYAKRWLSPSARLSVQHYRVSAGVMALLMIASILVPVLSIWTTNRSYDLTPQTRALLGETNTNLLEKLTFDPAQNMYQFNKDAKKAPTTDGNPIEQLQNQVGGAGKEDEQLYSVDVSRNINKGVTYYDNQMQLSFKVTPQFETRPGEKKEGHLIYPLLGNKGQLAYTVTAGGLKENLILQESPGDSFVMDYKLELPDSLEAKLLETGEVGVYAADPALFGQITYGSSDDQARVEEARTKSPKTHLAFVIPAPVVLGVGQEDQSVAAPVKSRFELSGTTLRVKTTGLNKATYPLSIDPTVTVTTNAEFATGNMEDNNLDVSGDSLTRVGLSGGATSFGSSTTAFTTGRNGHTTLAHNGYLYVLGGLGGGGSGSQTFNFTGGAQSFLVPAGVTSISVDARGARGGGNGGNGGRVQATLAVTPGETLNMYVGGTNGYNGGGAAGSAAGGGASDVRRGGAALGNRVVVAAGGGGRGLVAQWPCVYSNSSSDGGIGGGTTGGDSGGTQSGKGGTQSAGGAGGTNGGNAGTLGSGGAGVGARTGGGGGGYYGGGGGGATAPGNGLRCGGGGGGSSYAGSGTSGVTHTQGYNAGNGSIIISYTIPAGVMNNVQYAPINSDGTLGWWTTTSSFSTARTHHTSAIYNGYMYVMGGWNQLSAYYSDVQKAKINSDGSIGEWSATTGLPSGRRSHSSVAYNGYIYSLGGSTGSGVFTNNALYAPLRADGTIGSWTSTTNLPTNLHAQTSVAYNGNVYIIGGHTGSGGVNSVHYASLNTDGTLGSWVATESFPGAGRWAHASVVYKGYVYVLGGYNGAASADTYFAPVYANGRLGTWRSMPALPVAGDYPAAAAYNGRIYFTGGYNNTNSYMNNVRYGTLNSPGGTWPYVSTTSFTNARGHHSAVAYNGYLYIIGGWNGSTTYNNVQYAPINTNGTLGTWANTTSFTTARYLHTSVAYNGYIYVIGGYTPSTASTTNNVQYAPINTNGTLGSWSNTTSFATARYSHTSVAYRGYVYIIGGHSGSSAINNVQYAPINTNGTLGSWSNTTNLTGNRYATAVAVYGNFLYITGGHDGANYLTTVQYAPINTNGTLGSWSTGPSFTTVRAHHSAIAYNGYLYVIAGAIAASTFTETVYMAPINSDGSIGAWGLNNSLPAGRGNHKVAVYNGNVYITGGHTTGYVNDVLYGQFNNGGGGNLGSFANTTSLPSFNAYIRSIAHNGYLYVIGGHDAVTSADRNTVSYAPINKNGTLGAWSATSNMTKPRSSPGVTISNGYIYAAGGYSTTDYLNDIEYAKINADGTIGTWALSGTFPHKRDSSGLHAYNNRLYLIGGWGYDGVDWGGMNYVHSAPINSNGTVGSWAAENSFNTRRGESTTALNNGYLYVMGGQSFDYNSAYNDVQYAKINGDGTVGTWMYTSSFHVGRYAQSTSVANGYMYITGGHNNSSNLIDVQYAAINADGTLGDWQQTSLYSIQRRRHAQVIYDGYLYMLGGDKGYSNADCRSSTSGQYCDSVQYAPINAIARKATYSKMIDLATESSIIDIAYTGTLHGGSAEVSYRSAGSDGVFDNRQSLASFVPSALCDPGGATARYIQLFVTLDDKDNGAFRDALGQNGAVLDSLTVTTDPGRAPPDKRMRHGKWFSEQTQRPYDTCLAG